MLRHCLHVIGVAIRELHECLEDLAIPDFFNFAQISKVLLQTLSPFFRHDVLVLAGHQVIDIRQEITALRVLYRRESIYQHLR